MTYAYPSMVKERLDTLPADSSQDVKIEAKLQQANVMINFELSFYTSIPVSAPDVLVDMLAEVEADLAAGLFLEDRGPAMAERANVFKNRAREALDKIINLFFKRGVVETG
ncbi:MAG: hypothetical protein QW334_00240 [Thermofilum sp.]